MSSLLNSTPAFLTRLKDFFIAKSPVGNLPWWAVVTIIAVVVIAIIVIICVSVSASKKKKARQTTENAAQDNRPAPLSDTESACKEPVTIETGPYAGSLKTSDDIDESEAATAPVKEEPAASNESEITEYAETAADDKNTQPAEPVSAAEPKPVKEAKSAPVKKEEKPVVKAAAQKPVKPVNKKSGANKPVIVGVDALPKKYQEKLNKEEPAGDIKAIENEAAADTVETFGKFVIKQSSNPVRPYCFALLANNGQLLFESESYKVKPRDNSIAAFKRNVKDGAFLIDEDKTGTFRYKLFSSKGTLIGVGETYKTKQACESSIESVKRFSETANLIEDVTVGAEEE